jgi:hypothetical protein
VNSKAPHCWLLLLLLLCRLLDRLAIGCMGRTTAVSACMCTSLNQRSNLLLPTCHLHSLYEDAPEEGAEGAVKQEGLFLEQRAWVPHGPLHHSRAPCLCLILCQLPELPFPLLLMASLLSSQPLSWGLGLQGQGQGPPGFTLGQKAI